MKKKEQIAKLENRIIAESTVTPMKWYPIDTAPLYSGEHILIGRYEYKGEHIGWMWIVSGEFEDGKFFSTFNDDFYPLEFYHTATHWTAMALPPQNQDD